MGAGALVIDSDAGTCGGLLYDLACTESGRFDSLREYVDVD